MLLLLQRFKQMDQMQVVRFEVWVFSLVTGIVDSYVATALTALPATPAAPPLPLNFPSDAIFASTLKAEEHRILGGWNLDSVKTHPQWEMGDAGVSVAQGGGKSLTYQLPAILNTGHALRSAGVEAVKITGSTPKSDQDVINAKLGKMIARQNNESDEIKLLYCTPEKIAESKWFLTLLR
ncbi:hypothetical protein FB446DRAFT_701187 [Lentinula raphanica]|nr:hypothetical protein FB446DRAFT_701187 [Lentinula raphanica]